MIRLKESGNLNGDWISIRLIQVPKLNTLNPKPCSLGFGGRGQEEGSKLQETAARCEFFFLIKLGDS